MLCQGVLAERLCVNAFAKMLWLLHDSAAAKALLAVVKLARLSKNMKEAGRATILGPKHCFKSEQQSWSLWKLSIWILLVFSFVLEYSHEVPAGL